MDQPEEFREDVVAGRFELVTGAGTAIADRRVEGESLYIDYVFAPESLRGKGAAGRLIRNVMEFASERGLQVVPVCGYAAAWIRKNAPEQGQ